MMGLAWSLPTGFNTPITYFYVVYFAALLMHRERRDHEACEKKWVLLKSFMMFADLNRLSAGMERTGKSTRSWCRGVSYHTYTEAKLDTKDCQISTFCDEVVTSMGPRRRCTIAAGASPSLSNLLVRPSCADLAQ